MSSAISEQHGAASEDISDTQAAWSAELNAACQSLQTEPADLEPLLVPLQEKRIPRQQVFPLLRQSWLRLKQLRDRQAQLTVLAENDTETMRFIEQGFSALQPGENFSLDDGRQAFEQASRRSPETGSSPELAAGLQSVQAAIAAINLDYRRAVERYAQAASTPGLSAALQWQYHAHQAMALQDLGREFMDDAALEEAISLYETRMSTLAPRAEKPVEWAATQHDLGNALGMLGQRQGGTWMLEKAIEAFEAALSERSRDRGPRDWAATRNSLGNTLGILAQRHADTDMLKQSINAFESALEEYTREQSPQDWAATQNNLAAALLSLGQSKKDKALVGKAVDAYKNVLQVWTRERAPLDWAATMNNLGTVLRMLGEYRKGPKTLEQSIAAYRNALAERTRERAPQDWAMTQNNLGAALYKLGERKDDPQLLEASIAAYENALEEWGHDQLPMTWAMTMANLGAARKALAEQLNDVDLARAALSEFEAVADAFRNASHAHYYELATEQVAKTRELERKLVLG
ncbi:MAG: tetratricopeptide repeat protein [Thiogranum sp.]|nr:tetratricopeptide repeat protein [Thiogranum sp.]